MHPTRNVCKFNQLGKCRFGTRCRFDHSGADLLLLGLLEASLTNLFITTPVPSPKHSVVSMGSPSDLSATKHSTVLTTVPTTAPASTTAPGKIVASRVTLTWELGHLPSLESETFFETILVKNRNEAGRGIHLPHERQKEIADWAKLLGFTTCGAMSLRRQLIRQMSCSDAKFWSSKNMGNERAANEHSKRFEAIVGDFLISSGVAFETEDDLKFYGCRNTPDFHIPAGCSINGTVVYWIDCKTFYGAASIAKDKKQPVGKLQAQAKRYNDVFGPGCFVFLNGFGGELDVAAGLLGEVLLLDATPLETALLFEMTR